MAPVCSGGLFAANREAPGTLMPLPEHPAANAAMLTTKPILKA